MGDYTRALAPALTGLLEPGEQLIIATPLVHDPGTTADVSLTDETANLLDPGLLIGGAHPSSLLQRAIFGRAVIGPETSAAAILHAAVAGGRSPALAVTDRRLLVLDVNARTGRGWRSWFGPVTYEASVLHAASREAVTEAVRAPAGALRRGRLLIGFSDGSSCALVAALPALADRVVDEIGVI